MSATEQPDGDKPGALLLFLRGLQRDETAAVAALIALTLLCAVWLAHPAPDMDMAAMAMAHEMEPAPWTFERFAFTFAMWGVMMAAMMLPSATPVILLQRRVAQHNRNAETPPSVSLLVLGYLIIWLGFAALAMLVQWLLSRAMLLSPMDALADMRLAGALLLLAGVYQLTPLKQRCLRFCRSPAAFLAAHYRPGAAGAFRMGLVHGGYCLACCWAIMALLFVGGVMNPLWIAGLGAFVLVEKLLPFGRNAGLVLGGTASALGIYFLAGGAF